MRPKTDELIGGLPLIRSSVSYEGRGSNTCRIRLIVGWVFLRENYVYVPRHQPTKILNRGVLNVLPSPCARRGWGRDLKHISNIFCVYINTIAN
jgi:hypothetical protein